MCTGKSKANYTVASSTVRFCRRSDPELLPRTFKKIRRNTVVSAEDPSGHVRITVFESLIREFNTHHNQWLLVLATFVAIWRSGWCGSLRRRRLLAGLSWLFFRRVVVRGSATKLFASTDCVAVVDQTGDVVRAFLLHQISTVAFEA